MSAAVVVRALFPHPGPKRAVRRASSGNRLSHLMAIVFALIPLAAMGHAYVESV